MTENTAARVSGLLSHRSVRFIAMLVSATLIVLAFPPSPVRSLALLTLVPLLLAVRAAGPLEAAVLGALWGMAGAYGITFWLPVAVSQYYQQPLWIGITLFAVASFLMGAIEYAAFAWFYRRAAARGLPCLPLLAACAWVTAELGRVRLLSGNPWGLIGYTQTGLAAGDPTIGFRAGLAPLWLIQVSDLGGVYAVGFVLVAVNAALVELWIAVREGFHRERMLGGVVVPLAVATVAWSYGAVQVARYGTENAAGTPATLVQGNLDLGSQWREELYGKNLDVYLRLTHEALESGAPSLVFWPENAMTFFVDEEPLYRHAIATITEPASVQLIAGAPRYEQPAEPRYFNSAFVIAPDGTIIDHYDKERLLPFAEYFPFTTIDLLRRSFSRVREFTPGAHTSPLPTRAGAAGVTICNEAMFPHLVRRRVLDGADYLVNLSNDTWIADPYFAEHQLALVSLRAAEFRRSLVRASTSGPSAFVDPLGRVVSRTDTQSQGVLTGFIRDSNEVTLYARYGDAFAWGCVAIALVAVFVRRRPSE